MKHLSLLILALALGLAGCGGTRGRDPLAGLAGPTDGSIFNFEADAQGWGIPLGVSTYQVFQTTGRSFFGTGSLAIAAQQMSNGSGGQAGAEVAITPGALVGKTIKAWLYAPQGAQHSDSNPSYIQLYVRQDGVGNYSNGSGPNAQMGNWVQVSFAPVANPQSFTATVNGNYCDANFDPATVDRLGIKVGVSGGAPAEFRMDAVFLLDSVSW